VDIRIAITGHDGLQHTVPIVGTMDLALAQQCPLKVAELIKTE
jgi:hypothetical protein